MTERGLCGCSYGANRFKHNLPRDRLLENYAVKTVDAAGIHERLTAIVAVSPHICGQVIIRANLGIQIIHCNATFRNPLLD